MSYKHWHYFKGPAGCLMVLWRVQRVTPTP